MRNLSESEKSFTQSSQVFSLSLVWVTRSRGSWFDDTKEIPKIKLEVWEVELPQSRKSRNVGKRTETYRYLFVRNSPQYVDEHSSIDKTKSMESQSHQNIFPNSDNTGMLHSQSESSFAQEFLLILLFNCFGQRVVEKFDSTILRKCSNLSSEFQSQSSLRVENRET